MRPSDRKGRAKNALDQARQFAEKGKFQEAMEKHIWFHDHALEVDPASRGVRLSFALSDWMELGRKYPPALQALRGIRDQKTSRLLAGQGDRNLFNDVEAINHYMGENQATVDLFKKIAAARPEFARSIYDLADEQLIAAEEYVLARKYLGDPNVRFGTAKQHFDSGMEYMEAHPKDDASRKAFEGIFTDEVIQIMTVLEKTGAPNEAREIQSTALQILDNPDIRGAISN